MADNSGFNISDTDLRVAQPILVGEGGTARCYRIDRYGKLMLMKRLKPELAHKALYQTALRKEFEAGARIDHPNVTRYTDFGQDHDGPYILMEYVDGAPLDKFVVSHPRYFREKRQRETFVAELLSAVECLHSHDIIHLDLSPANILITSQGHHVKLTDLGMAFTSAFPANYGGTAGYSAPEVLAPDGPRPTARADIYSLGQLLALTGCAAPRIIRRCTATAPAQRYATIDDLRLALRRQGRLAWARRAVVVAATIVLLLVGGLMMPFTQSRLTSSALRLPWSAPAKGELSNDAAPGGEENASPTGLPTTAPGGQATQPGNTAAEPGNPASGDAPAATPSSAQTNGNANGQDGAEDPNFSRNFDALGRQLYAAVDKQLAHPPASYDRSYFDATNSLITQADKQLWEQAHKRWPAWWIRVTVNERVAAMRDSYKARLAAIEKPLTAARTAEVSAASARSYKRLHAQLVTAYNPLRQLKPQRSLSEDANWVRYENELAKCKASLVNAINASKATGNVLTGADLKQISQDQRELEQQLRLAFADKVDKIK